MTHNFYKRSAVKIDVELILNAEQRDLRVIFISACDVFGIEMITRCSVAEYFIADINAIKMKSYV